MGTKVNKNVDESGISTILEKCIFNVKELKALKQTAIRMGIPESDGPKFTEILLTYLTKVLKVSVGEISFYFDNWLVEKKLKEYAKEGNNGGKETEASKGIHQKLEQQVRERDELLITLKERIARIHAHIADSKPK